MRFEFEKIDIKFLQRRAREEQAKKGRRVTDIYLNPDEWREFAHLHERDFPGLWSQNRKAVEFVLQEMPSCVPWHGELPPHDTVQTIRVRPA